MPLENEKVGCRTGGYPWPWHSGSRIEGWPPQWPRYDDEHESCRRVLVETAVAGTLPSHFFYVYHFNHSTPLASPNVVTAGVLRGGEISFRLRFKRLSNLLS